MSIRKLIRLTSLVLAAGAVLGWALLGGTRETCIAAVTAAGGETPAPPLLSARIRAEGRLAVYPGADVVVGADLGGRLTSLAVHEQETVRRGQVLAEVLADEQRAALAEARARVDEAAADVKLAEVEVARQERLVTSSVAPKAALDAAERNLDAARARRATAVATTHRLQALLDKSVIRAPIDGTVLERRADAGEMVDEGTPLLRVADMSRTRIEAEVDEYDAARIRIGAAARITAEGHDGAVWLATVEEIPRVVGARRLEPQDPGRPSDTRVLVVKLALQGETPLLLGQRVEVEIDAAGEPR